jgi:hypothetical protein
VFFLHPSAWLSPPFFRSDLKYFLFREVQHLPPTIPPLRIKLGDIFKMHKVVWHSHPNGGTGRRCPRPLPWRLCESPTECDRIDTVPGSRLSVLYWTLVLSIS